jgi:hypothetical protein
MKDRLFTLVCLVAIAELPVCIAADKEPVKKPDKAEVSLWMQKKLLYSQRILAGLTKADFALIKKNAELMQVIGYLEAYDRAEMPEYKRQLGYFYDANKELIRQSGKKNISASTLAYTQVTNSCVQCHTVIRDAAKK